MGSPDRTLYTLDQDSGIHKVDLPLPGAHLPALSALTEVEIQLYSEEVSCRLAALLSSVHSAPALSSVTFASPIQISALTFPSSGPWVSVDKWLARLAGKRDRTEAGLVVVLIPWSEGNTNWEGYFPEFSMAGGQLTVELVSDPGW